MPNYKMDISKSQCLKIQKPFNADVPEAFASLGSSCLESEISMHSVNLTSDTNPRSILQIPLRLLLPHNGCLQLVWTRTRCCTRSLS